MIPEHLSCYPLERYAIVDDQSVRWDCNWKIAMDAFHESYHTLGTHPQMMEYVADTNVQIDCYGRHSRFLMPWGAPAPRVKARSTPNKSQAEYFAAYGFDVSTFEGTADDAYLEFQRRKRDWMLERGYELDDLDLAQFSDVCSYTVFPNVQIALAADRCLLTRHRPDPRDPTKMIFDAQSFAHVPPGEPWPERPATRAGRGARLRLRPRLRRAGRRQRAGDPAGDGVERLPGVGARRPRAPHPPLPPRARRLHGDGMTERTLDLDDFDLDDQFVVAIPPSERFPAYTRANVGEVWAGPTTPLTTSSMSGMWFERAWRDALVRVGAFDLDEFDPDQQEILGVFYGYIYLNLSVQRVFGVRMPGASADIIDASFFGGGAVDVPPYRPDPRDESDAHAARIGETIGWCMGVERLPGLDDDREQALALRAKRPDLSALSDVELFEYARPLLTTEQQRLMTDHMLITAVSSIPIGLITAVAAQLGDPGLGVRAIAGLGDVDSAAPVWAMWEMGRLVAASPRSPRPSTRGSRA